jgi:hypothetical protein
MTCSLISTVLFLPFLCNSAAPFSDRFISYLTNATDTSFLLNPISLSHRQHLLHQLLQGRQLRVLLFMGHLRRDDQRLLHGRLHCRRLRGLPVLSQHCLPYHRNQKLRKGAGVLASDGEHPHGGHGRLDLNRSARHPGSRSRPDDEHCWCIFVFLVGYDLRRAAVQRVSGAAEQRRGLTIAGRIDPRSHCLGHVAVLRFLSRQ